MSVQESVTVLKHGKFNAAKSTRFSKFYTTAPSLMSTAESAERDRLQNRREFCIHTVAFLMGLQNLWRFPREAYLKGQGAFVWAYLIVMFAVGSCLLFFEVALGQSVNMKYNTIFAICPFFEGLSIAMGIYCMLVAVYYNVINVFSAVHFIGSFSLDYATCESYATESFCLQDSLNQTLTPEFAFFKYHILNNYSKNSNLFEINWRCSLVLLFFWIVIAIAILRGVKHLIWPAALSCALQFLIFGITLVSSQSIKGATDGLRAMFLWPKDVPNLMVWLSAIEQVVVSLGLGMGQIITFGSYLKFHTPSDRDSVCAVIFVSTAAFLSGAIVFSTAGILAEERSQNIDTVLKKTSTDLYVHVTFSQLFTRMSPPWSNLNAILFFLTLLLAGLYSLVTFVESAMLMCYTYAPRLAEYRIYTTLLFCLLCFLLSLVLLLPSGYHSIISLDHSLVSITLIVMIICELCAVIYIYGIHDFSDDLIFMIGFEPNFYIKMIWILSPFALLAFVIMTINAANFGGMALTEKITGAIALVVVFAPLILIALHNVYQFYKAGNAMSVFAVRAQGSDSQIDIYNGRSVPWFRRMDSTAGPSYA